MAVRSGNILHSLFLELRDEHFWRTNSGVSLFASRLTSFCQLLGDWYLLLDRLLCRPPSTFVGSYETAPKGRTFLRPSKLIVGSTHAPWFSETMTRLTGHTYMTRFWEWRVGRWDATTVLCPNRRPTANCRNYDLAKP